MERHLYKIEGLDIHVRSCGTGFPLLLLHASPSSSGMFGPFAEELKKHFTLIMPDTPGYGLSDSLASPAREIADYVPIFKKLLDAMGISSCGIYGSATGAQLAIRMGLMHPDLVAHIFLDNAAHFSSEQYDNIIARYFPDLTPTYDGSHLLKMWTIVRDMFRYFPWFMRDDAHKLAMPPLPAAVYHRVAMDFLQAGKKYDEAYAAAFAHERVENVEALQVPTSLFRHVASIVLPYIDQLIQHPQFPDRIPVIEIPASPKERFERMKDHMIEVLSNYEEGIEIKPPALDQEGQFLLPVQGGYLHGWHKMQGKGKAVAILPNIGDSAILLKGRMEELMGERPGVILSLPGQGESDVVLDKGADTSQMQVVKELMDLLGYTDFEILKADSVVPEIEIGPPDAYGMYMLQAWIQLREKTKGDISPKDLHIVLREKLKSRKL